MEVMMALSPTDLPWPVAPATRRGGVLAKSNTSVSFEIFLPSATGSSYSDSWNFLDLMTEFIETTCGFELGTSMPMEPRPGSGAMMRMPSACRLRAISFSNP